MNIVLIDTASNFQLHMFKGKYVFSQIIAQLNRNKFNRIASKYEGDKYVKHFTCWNQLLALIYGQLSHRDSLRKLIVTLDANQSKCYHLGMGKNISRSSLARANRNRDYHIFEEFAYFLIKELKQKSANNATQPNENVYAFDSTTIDLCLFVFLQAKLNPDKNGLKVHTLYDTHAHIPTLCHITEAYTHDSKALSEVPYSPGSYYILDREHHDLKALSQIDQKGAYFIIPPSANLDYEITQWKRNLSGEIKSDVTITLTSLYGLQYYPQSLRLVKYWDEAQQKVVELLTNAAHISAHHVIELYRNHSQAKQFLQWVTKHMKHKKFWGATENAVRIHIYTAICTYCLISLVQQNLQLNLSADQITHTLGSSLLDKVELKELFGLATK